MTRSLHNMHLMASKHPLISIIQNNVNARNSILVYSWTNHLQKNNSKHAEKLVSQNNFIEEKVFRKICNNCQTKREKKKSKRQF